MPTRRNGLLRIVQALVEYRLVTECLLGRHLNRFVTGVLLAGGRRDHQEKQEA